GAVDVLEELGAGRLGRSRGAGPAVAAAEYRARVTLAAGHGREREPAELGVDVLVGGVALSLAGLPVALQFHRHLAVRQHAGGAGRAALRLAGVEPGLERVRGQERGESFRRLGVARPGPARR